MTWILVFFLGGAMLSSCAKETGAGLSTALNASCSARTILPQPTSACASQDSCPVLAGSPWVPNVAGMSASNHGSGTTARTVITKTGVPLLGLSQADPGNGHEVTVTIDMSADLGAYGSVTLEASVKNFPAGLSGHAYPALVYLSDGVNDYINLARSGSGSDCVGSGYYTCNNGACYPNPNCSIRWPSAYIDRDHWEQHQITNQNTALTCEAYPSVNTFPTCNWSQGVSPPTPSQPSCAFNSNFFTGSPARLRTGVYTAKYVLLASDYSTLNGYAADLEVTVVKKQDTTNALGRAIDLNVILVGTKNVQASRTTAGQRNLDTLFTAVYNYYNQSGVGVKLGKINAIEWACDKCGDAYANTDISNLDQLFSQGSSLVSSSTEGKAINLYLVSMLPDAGSGSNLTVLGISGGIGGPVSKGGPTSGVAFSSFNQLDSFNPSCGSSNPCPASTQQAAFWDLGVTIAHEMGHYLGLNHPSESDGTSHDAVYDTPICTATDPLFSTPYITTNSCLNYDTNSFPSTGKTCNQACAAYDSANGVFCSTVSECQFNHIMWWTSKKFKEGMGTGDGAIFSGDTGKIINYNPFVL